MFKIIDRIIKMMTITINIGHNRKMLISYEALGVDTLIIIVLFYYFHSILTWFPPRRDSLSDDRDSQLITGGYR